LALFLKDRSAPIALDIHLEDRGVMYEPVVPGNIGEIIKDE